MWSWLRSWWRQAPVRRDKWFVRLYTRAGCHLCDDAWALLEEARERHGFNLEAVDVDTDPELAARYGLEVPVVEVNDKVRFRGRINPILLRRLLESG
jgi:glutaredoxin